MTTTKRIAFGHTLITTSLLMAVSIGMAWGTDKQQALSDQHYLQQHYGIILASDATNGEFLQVLARTTGLPDKDVEAKASQFPAKQALSRLNALRLGLWAAGLEELAATYSADQVRTSLATLPADSLTALDDTSRQQLAAAVDSGLLAKADAPGFKPDATIQWDEESTLLGRVLAIKGNAQRPLGTTLDSDILAKLQQRWQTLAVIDAPTLQNTFDQALKQGLITGYNLKDQHYNPRFDPVRSLTYGHADIRHAQQLVVLLHREGIQAKLQLEPKTSAYIYLKEWGAPSPSEDLKLSPLPNGNAIAYAREYDLELEFASIDQKNRFDQIVSRYAKKDKENQPGLIYEAWWQPLYTSSTEVKGYAAIRNTTLAQGHYLAQTFSLPEKTAAVTAGIKTLAADNATPTQETLWVDQPFYHYLHGDYK